MMKILASLAVAISLTSCSLSGELSTNSGSTNAPADQPTFDSTTLMDMEPNVQFEVTAESGTCPDTVGLWEFGLGFEGGADHTVVVDTSAISSQPAQLTVSEAKRVVYEAPLKDEFASCVGTANSEYLSMYDLSFADGKVQFDLNLTNDDGFREIRYADISANRPYVHWRAAE
ncbi:MAG: hypothetical protein ACTS2F_13010 [Thainema sp.]